VVCLEYDNDLHLLQGSDEVMMIRSSVQTSSQLIFLLCSIPVLNKCVNSFFPLYIDALSDV
jgi:hypothetical protein